MHSLHVTLLIVDDGDGDQLMFGGREEPSLQVSNFHSISCSFSYSHHQYWWQETAKRGNVLSLSAITASRSTRSTSVSSSQPASPNTSSFRLDSTQQLGAARPLQTVKANRFSDVLTARNHRPRVSSHEKESRPSTSSHGVNHSKEKDNGDAASSFNLGELKLSRRTTIVVAETILRISFLL